MTRSLSILLVLLAFGVLALPSNAQFRVGAAYGTEAELGVAAGFQLPFSLDSVEGLSFGVDGIFYIPRSEGPSGAEVDITAFEVNGNAHYPLTDAGSGKVYALAGLQYAYVKADVTVFGISGSASDSQVGLNLGGGINFGMLFGEAKYSLGGMEQLALTVGVSF